jgi:hypothetical protein
MIDTLVVAAAAGLLAALVGVRQPAWDGAITGIGVSSATKAILYFASVSAFPFALWAWAARTGLSPGRAAFGLRIAESGHDTAPGIGRLALRGLLAAIGPWIALTGWTLGTVASAADHRQAGTILIGVASLGGSVAAAAGVVAALVGLILDPATRRTWYDNAAGLWVVDRRMSESPGNPLPAAHAVPAQARLPSAPTRRTEPDATLSASPTQPPAAPAGPPTVATPSAAPGRAGRPPEATPPGPAIRPHLLCFDTGQMVTVEGLGLVGRRPMPAAGVAAAHLVPIPDPELSVSKTHLEFGLNGRELWIRDRGSTNGTVIRHADGSVDTAAPGIQMAVKTGETVKFGDRSFSVGEG